MVSSKTNKKTSHTNSDTVSIKKPKNDSETSKKNIQSKKDTILLSEDKAKTSETKPNSETKNKTNNETKNKTNSETKNKTNSETKNKTNSETEKSKLNALEKLYSFMKKYRNESKAKTGKNLPWTNSMTYEPYGSYDIPDDMYRTFLKLYEDAIVAGYRPHITEKHKEFGPIVIDFDFVHDKKYNKRQYTEQTIEKIIRIYNRIIKKYLDVSNNKIHAYVLEKKEATLRQGKYHDGIHIAIRNSSKVGCT